MASSHRRSRGSPRRHYTAQRIRRIEGTTLLVLAVLAVAVVTVVVPPASRAVPAVCLVCGPHPGTSAMLELALFMPVGAALALLGTPWRVALAIGVGISITVELLQLTLPIGGAASLSDLVANLAGTAAGLHVTRRRRAILYPRSRTALRYAIIGGGVWLLVLLATSLLLRPSIPAGELVGQWQPVLSEGDVPGGRVASASAAGMPVIDGPVSRSEALRTALQARLQVDLQAEFTVVGSGSLTGIFRLATDTDREIALVAQRGDDLVFRARMLATDLGLVTPSVVMYDALAGIDVTQPRLLPIEARRDGGALRLSAYGRETTLGLHSGVGWMFLLPTANPMLHTPGVGSGIWVGLPLFLIAYWTGRRARRKARRAGDAFRLTGTGGQVLAALPLLAALIIAGLAGISLATGLSLPSGTVWAAATFAVGLGMAAGIWIALSHDDRAHGLSALSQRSTDLSEPTTASGAFGAIP